MATLRVTYGSDMMHNVNMNLHTQIMENIINYALIIHLFIDYQFIILAVPASTLCELE